MEITPWFMYWFTRLDALNDLCTTFSIILGVILVAAIVFAPLLLMEPLPKDKEKIGKWVVRGVIAVVFAFVLTLFGKPFIPTTKEAAAIYLVPAIINNEQVQKVPTNAMKLLNKKLEQYLIDNEVIEKEE